MRIVKESKRDLISNSFLKFLNISCKRLMEMIDLSWNWNKEFDSPLKVMDCLSEVPLSNKKVRSKCDDRMNN